MRKEALKDLAIQTGWDVVGGTVSGGAMGGVFSVGQLAQYKAEQKARQQLAEETVGTQNAYSRRLTDDDIDDYMQVGERRHVRDTKQRIIDSGESPILTKVEEISAFIRNAFRRNIQKTVKAYGRVNNRLANAVKSATKGEVNIDDYYLELDADKIAHMSDHIGHDKDIRNIPLTEKQLEQLPEYIDFYDDLIDVIRRKDGSVRLMLGKKINGHSIIVETVSKGRMSLHPVTAYQIDSSDYLKYYKTRAIDRSSTSRSENTDTVDISRPTIALTNSISQTMPGVNGEISSAEGQVLRDGNPVQIANVESAGKGKLTVKLTDGSTADVSELSFPDAGEQELWRVLAEYSDNAEAARQLLKEYRAGDLKAFEFAKGVEEGFVYGKLNISEKEMSQRGSYVNLLNPMQRNMAYKYGQFAGEKQARQRRTEAAERSAKRERKGGVHYGYEGQKLDKSKLSKAQRVGVDFAERLARRKGITTYFYRSYVNEQGQRVYKNREGNIVLADENGWYDPSDGSIHIDLNSGDMGSTVLFTIAHELTHFIQDWSADRYRTLCKILTEGYLEMGQSVDELVRNKQEEYREKNEELSYEEAFDEVIASSMEGVLSAGRVMDLLDDVETKDMSLAERIRIFLEETAELLRDTIQAYRGVKPESPEGRIVQRMQSIHNQLQEVFAAGLHEGGENYRQGGKINTAQTGGRKMKLRYANGSNVVWIENSGFTNSQLRNPNAIAKYIVSHIGDVYRIIESGQSVYIGPDLPGEYTYSEYTSHLQKNNRSILRAKNKATLGIGEMIEIATNRRWEKTKHSHNKDAKYGMYRYDTYFAFPIKDRSGQIIAVKAYSAELLIRNASDGKKYLYDVVNIKEDTAKALDLQNKETRNGNHTVATRSSVLQEQYMQNGGKSQQKSIRYQKNAIVQEQLRTENANMDVDVSGLNELVAAMKRQGKDGSLTAGTLDAAATALMQKAVERVVSCKIFHFTF